MSDGVNFHDPIEELRKREFTMKCTVKRVKVAFSDDAYDNNSHADLVCLIPYPGTERDMFMTAWYNDATPVKNGEGHLTSKVELPAYVASPISMPSMVRLNWPNQICQEPHLMVMTVAIEHLMNTHKEVSTIELKIFTSDKMDELGLSNGVVRI